MPKPDKKHNNPSNPAENNSQISAFMRENSNKLIILVESPADTAFYRNFIDLCRASISSCNGKFKLHEKLEEENQKLRQPPAYIGICDADFGRICGFYPPKIDNLFYTDAHDREIMVIENGQVWEHIVSKIDAQNLSNDVLLDANEFKKKLLEALYAVSCLRLVLTKHLEAERKKGINYPSLPFKFRKEDKKRKELVFLDYTTFVEIDLKINVDILLKRVAIFSEEKENYFVNDMEGKKHKVNFDAELVVNQKEDLLELTNGHDVIHLLAICLKAHPVQIEEGLLWAFQKEHFAQTNLYKELRDWENTHKYSFLKKP